MVIGVLERDVLDYLRCDDLAWTAPGSETVEDEKSVLLLEGLVEVGLAV